MRVILGAYVRTSFDADLEYRGPGHRYDRVFFPDGVWAEAHLVGQGRRFFEGREFNLSDHFGVMCYVDVHEAYGSKGGFGGLSARARRGELVAMKDVSLQTELQEALAVLQSGRSEQAVARQRASERERVDHCRMQREGRSLPKLCRVTGVSSTSMS